MDRREELLNGQISFPKQIMSLVNPNNDLIIDTLINQFWNGLTWNYLNESTLDTITWFDKFDNSDLFNLLLFHLSKSGWIKVNTEMNYSYIELLDSKIEKWLSKDEIIEIKRKFKFNKYKYGIEESNVCTLVKCNNSIIETGLERQGFMKSGNNQFGYDLKYLHKYLKDIAWNIEKGVYLQSHTNGSSTKDIKYQDICDMLVEVSSSRNKLYNLNKVLLDSRGRSIFQCTKKVFNPISCKPARASIMLEPEPLTPEGEKHVYLFISELLGYRPECLEHKIELGREAYEKRLFPREKRNELGYLENSEEFIWLERLYENLENPREWRTSIEIDAMSSILQMMGVLTNNHKYLLGTNLGENNNQLQDMWTIPNIPRILVKKAMTPILYGSSASPDDIWTNLHLEYTEEHLKIILKELVMGRFKEANDFRDFVISNVNPSAEMRVKIFNDNFLVKCNKFKWEETVTKQYYIYSIDRLRKITRSVTMVPDLKRFKTYFLTLLCHNLDSQVANHIGLNMDWVLCNHDAFILHPNNAQQCKNLYVEYMTKIYKNRHSILSEYFKSIGLNKSFEDIDKEELPLCGNALK